LHIRCTAARGQCGTEQQRCDRINKDLGEGMSHSRSLSSQSTGNDVAVEGPGPGESSTTQASSGLPYALEFTGLSLIVTDTRFCSLL